MLVRRAVTRAGQWLPLTRRPATRGCVTDQRRAADRMADARLQVDPVRGQAHVALDDVVCDKLLAQWEQHAHVVEQRACRAREVVPIVREAFNGGLTRRQQFCLCGACSTVRLSLDEISQLSVHRTTELEHHHSPIEWRTSQAPGRWCTVNRGLSDD